MKNPARVVKGQRVKAGQIVGNVGTTHDRRLGGFLLALTFTYK